MKAAFITGITGQCGSYLAELLLEKGYTVHGMIRRSSNFNTSRIDHIFDKLHLYHGDMTDISSIIHILEQLKGYERIEIYNLAAQSHVKVSFDNPLYTAQVDAIGTLNLLEAVRITGLIDKARIYQASTSEMYGQVVEIPQKRLPRFIPDPHMEWQRFMLIGLVKIIRNRMECTFATEFYLTMSLVEEHQHLLLKK